MYKHILLATDLTNANRSVVEKALTFATQFNCKLSVIHVVEPAVSYAYAAALGFAEPEQPSTQLAKEAMQALCKEYNIPPEQAYVKIGSAKAVILELADELNIDYIVMGSHSKHGVEAVLGSSAYAVTHGAKCDVTIVRLPL